MSVHHSIATLLVLGALSACGGGGDDAPANAGAGSDRPVSQSNIEIATLLYSDMQRTPDGFYTEATPVTAGYVSTQHIKSTDLGGDAVAYELCSNDWNQALGWSQGLHGSDGAQSVGDNVTDKYFEFNWLIGGNPQNYRRERVFKCAYVDRFGVDLATHTGAAGVLNARPLDASTLKALSEYLWHFSYYNNFGNAVLKSSASSDGSLAHSLVMASLTRADSGTCDTIDVIDLKLTADAGGVLQTSLTSLWSFRAQQVGGAVSLCN